MFCKKKIRFKTPMLRSDLCDDSNAYIVLKGIICVTDTGNINNRGIKKLAFKNNAPLSLFSCISCDRKSITHL